MEFNSSFYFSIFIFLLTYAGIMSERIPRSLCALLGAGLVVYSGLVTQEMALRHFIDFNTIGLLAGMMILIGVVKKSGFFEAMALWSVKISKGRPKELLIILGLITGFCASFMDAVTAVLLITPMTISLCRRIHVTPIPTLIAEILLSNIGGSGTMVGDPPNVMIGSATHLVFNDFAMNTGPIALLNVAACIIYLEIIYGKELPKTEMTEEELGKISISSVITDYSILKKSVTILALTIFGFIVHNIIGIESATIALTGGVLAILACSVDPHEIFRDVDWDSLFFFIGLFIVVGGLETTGVINALAQAGISAVGGDPEALTFTILWLSGIASAFIDNIPFTATMIPPDPQYAGAFRTGPRGLYVVGAFYRRVLRRQRHHHRRFAERHRRGSCGKRRVQYYFRPLHVEMFPHDARDSSHIHLLSLCQVLPIRHSVTSKGSASRRGLFYFPYCPPSML